MKTRKKMKSHSKQKSSRSSVGMQRTREVSKSRVRQNETSNRFTPMETGAPEQNLNEGGGPLNMEGEGERQNDQLAELEQIEPDHQ